MARRRVGRRRRVSGWLNMMTRRRQNVSVASKSSRDINKSLENHANRNHDHPYGTRSKTLRSVESSMNVDEDDDCVGLKRRQSDGSIIFLGKYRKVPELVVIDETEGGRCTEFVEIPKSVVCLKEERIRNATKA